MGACLECIFTLIAFSRSLVNSYLDSNDLSAVPLSFSKLQNLAVLSVDVSLCVAMLQTFDTDDANDCPTEISPATLPCLDFPTFSERHRV